MSGWDSRPLAELQLGNGTLLATFDPAGEIEQIFAPHLDALQSRIGAFRSFVLLSRKGEGDGHPVMIPVNGIEFDVKITLSAGTQILQADYQHKSSGLRVTRRVGLHPTEPLFLDSWKVLAEGAGILHQSIPWIGGATSAHCSLYNPALNGLVHHRGRRWMGICVRGEAQWGRVGHLPDDDRRRLWDGERIYAPVGPHDLGGFPARSAPVGLDHVVQGPGTWGALAAGPSDTIEFLVICAGSEAGLAEVLGRVRNIETSRYFQMIEGMSKRRHAPGAAMMDRIGNPEIRALAERSVDVLHALQDAGTGALMAAAEVDPHFRASGGYGYSWPRDGAYLATALGAFGFRERVEHYFEFIRQTQDSSGAWWQRYLATGHAGPSWGRVQIDEPATVIGAAYLHFRQTGDLFWLEKMWPTLEKGLAYLETFHGPAHPLGLPSHDLWEERMGVHAYSLGAVASAFFAGAYLAGELSDQQRQERYAQWGTALSAIIAEKFVPAGGPIRRAFIAHSWDYQRGGGSWDETADVSLLGLITPFAIFRKRDPASTRILELVRSRLWCGAVGGVLRYERDHYRGGNPWVLTTLWLAIIELSLENHEKARELFQWVLSKTTPHGLLAEQVHRDTGQPCWVIPLGWSHAMFLLFVREVIERGAEKQIWEN